MRSRRVRSALVTALPALTLAACEAPSQSPPDQSPPSAESAPATDGAMTEPPFAGRWAANADWCATTDGAERPIRITASRFEGYENHCDIRSVVRTPEGWDATLACQAEGESHQERVSMDVRDERMTLTWSDREGDPVRLVRCEARAEPPP